MTCERIGMVTMMVSGLKLLWGDVSAAHYGKSRSKAYQKIIGSTIGGHSGPLSGSNTADSTVVTVVDWEVEENGASDECALDILNVFVGPVDRLVHECGNALLTKVGGLCEVPESSLENVSFASLDAHREDLPDLVQYAAIRWVLDELVVQEPKE